MKLALEGEDEAEHTHVSHQTSPWRVAGSSDDVLGEGRRRMHLPITLAMFFLATEDGFTLPDTKLGALLLSGPLCFVAGKGPLPLQHLGSQEMLGTTKRAETGSPDPGCSLGTEPAACSCVMKHF